MACYKLVGVFVAISAFFSTASARAVNISNTWMLPEEGFPVFYRYFRDRISWYEADAVCQFHHANLVTADSTSQYDAIRAYLKEMDITDNIWIGLSKTAEKPNFTWTSDFRPLEGEGHWREAIPSSAGSQPLCVVMDPAADFLWRALPCGGPEVAAFICELPVPTWASGAKGCLLTELPSLTVLYIPEQSALELTSDCGLDGTKRISCKGNADREDILRQLTCVISNEEDFDDKSTKSSVVSSTEYDDDNFVDGKTYESTEHNFVNEKTTKSWTSNTVDDGVPTRHRRETEDTLSPVVATKSTFKQTYSTTDPSWTEKNKLTTAEIYTTTPSTTYEQQVSIGSSLDIDTTLDSSVLGLFGTSEKSATASDESALMSEKSAIAFEKFAIPFGKSATDSKKFKKAASEKTTETEATTQDSDNVRPEEGTMRATATSAPENRNASSAVEEYPSAISQGQLFSIIENGTMFDIIELNETAGGEQLSDLKTKENKPHEIKSTAQTATTEPSMNTAFTTAIYNKDASPSPTNKTMKKTGKHSKKNPKDSDAKKNNYPSPPKTLILKKNVSEQKTDKTSSTNPTKEFEMLPVIKDSSIKLNRTFRKELPPMNEENYSLESGGQFGIPKVINFSIGNSLNTDEAEVIYQEADKTKNITETLVISTLKENKEQIDVNRSPAEENIETFDVEAAEPAVMKHIDPQIDLINRNLPENNDSEVIQPVKLKKSTENFQLVKEQFLPKTLLGESEPTDSLGFSNSSEAPRILLSENPQARPNRKRQLTRPQRKSFYPNFFSRMLG